MQYCISKYFLSVKKKSEELFAQECFDQQLKSCENTHEDCCDVVPESLHEQHPFENKTTPKNEHYLENRNNTTNIDSGDEKSYNYSISLYKRNSKGEAVEKNLSERSLNYNRARQASKKLDEPKLMDGVINPVGRVHSEPLTLSSLMNTSRAKSPRRKIFETKSDKMVSRTVGSGYTGEEEEEEGHDSKDRALYKRRNECQTDVHRSLTDHRAEGTNMLSSARNKYEVSYRTTASLNDSTESHNGQHQQNDSSDESATHCLNSRQEQNDPVRENSHLSGVVKENERVQPLKQEEVDNVDEQKQPHEAELTSPVHNGRLLLTLPLPLSSHQYPGTVDRFCSRPDCSSDRNRLTRRRSTYGSIGDLYVSRTIQMRSMQSDYSYGLSPSGVAQSAMQKKTRISSPAVETSSHCDQLKLLSPSQSLIKLHTKRTKASCETSESNLKGLEGSATDPIQYLLCCRTTSKEALAAEQVMQTIERDQNSLLQKQMKFSLRHNSPTSFTAKHRTPNKAAAQSNLLEDDQQTEEMLIESYDEMSEDKLEVKNNVEFVRSSHQGQIGKNEEIMPCTEFMDLLEEHRPIKQPVRNSLVSVKPENGFVSMYRTQGPITAKFSDVRVKTVVDPIDSKAASGLQRNNSSQERDLYQLQTLALDTCKTPTNQAKPIVRGHSSSKPLTKLTADKGDKYLRRCDNGHQTLFRLQPNFRWPKTRQKRDISPYLHASCSTDSITTDCELNARSLHTQVQHLRDAFKRRHHSYIKATKTAPSACDSASSAGPSANFRTVFRQSRQQLAEEQEEGDETSSVEELLKGNNHPLYLSESESEVDTCDDRNRGCSREILNSPESTRNGETELLEQERTEITRQILIDRNRVLFEETLIFQFRQRVCMMLIGVIFILVFYINIIPIVQSTIFRKSDS